LSQYYDPEPIPKPHALATELMARGHDVEVLTGLPNYPTGSLARGYRLTAFKREVRDAIPVARVFELPYHGRSMLGRLANYGSFGLSALLAAGFLARPDVMYVWSPPLTVGVVAAIVAQSRRLPFVYDLQDIWPDTLIFAGLPPNSRAASLMRLAERHVYRQASRILVPTQGAKANLESKGITPSKVLVLPHWVNPDDFVAVDKLEYEERRAGLHADLHNFVVTYAGNVGFAQGLDTLVAAADLLRARPQIVFRIIGDGAAAGQLADNIAARNLSNIQLIGRRSRAETSRLLALSDTLVVLLRNRELSEIAMPGKTMTYMASGRPVVMAASGAGAALIRAAAAGDVVPPADPQALASAIVRLSESPKRELDATGARGADYVRANYSRSTIIHQLETILKTAAGLD
jgi:colanic acid biosynthesis glycosyl transferase WcaI